MSVPNDDGAVQAVSREDVLTAVREILQRDLKFGGMDVTEQLVLVGGGLTLDSLDLLMLVTGVEKRFGHKISQKKLNQDTMATVGRFVDFAHAELVAARR